MKTVSAVLIVKNEEALLGRCLESVKDADEIIICDTGSTDNTIEIAKKYTDKIYTDFLWNDSFCDARNHAKSKATSDWILSIDADEFCHDFSEVRKAIELGDQAIGVHLRGESGRADFLCPRLFKNIPEIHWEGAVHNHLSIGGSGEQVGNVVITYGYSPAHALDPDRSLRILEKEVQDPTKCRELYYLGRELWYKGRYLEATRYFGKHVQMTNFTAEKADSFLTMARCYSTLGMDNDARDACVQAIICNPYFYEAIKFMSNIVPPEHVAPWRKMLEVADSRDVLFVRE